MADSRYSVLKDGTLMIERTSERDMGVYECVARSPVGEVKSRSARMEPHKQGLGRSHVKIFERVHRSDHNGLNFLLWRTRVG